MFRLRHVVVLALAGCVVAGCSGADAQRAQELLSQVQAAQAKMISGTVDARLVVSSGSQRMTMFMSGGGYLRGPHAGEQHLTISTEGSPVPLRAEIVTMDGRGYLKINGAWRSFPLPAQAQQAPWTASMSEFARYVKEVNVTENTAVAGEPGTTVSGVLDTAGLLRSMSQMTAFSGATGSSSLLSDEIARHVSDIRVVLFISARTHLVRSAVVSYEINVGGQKAKFDLYISRTGLNRPVAIPTPQ